MQVYLDNSAYKISNKQLTDNLVEKLFEDEISLILYHRQIAISEVIDLSKDSNSKECVIFPYWFFNHRFKFQDIACNVCHVFPMLCGNISDIAFITVKNVDYCCIIQNISKSEAIQLL